MSSENKPPAEPQASRFVPTTRAVSLVSEPKGVAAFGTGIASVLRKLTGRGAPMLDRIAVVTSVLLLVFSAIGPFIAPGDPYKVNVTEALQGPSGAHWFGTDDVGRDVLSRILTGVPLTLLSAVCVVLIATVVGVIVASIAAISPRWLDDIIMRIAEIFMSIPSLVLALGLAAALGRSLTSIVIAMVIALWPPTARMTRNILRETMSSTYVEAAKVLGVSKFRLMLRHALPNSMDAVYVFASMEISGAIVMMAGLSFLGVGAPPPSADWGSMIAQGQDYITSAWWVSLFPGLAITIAAVAFGLLGDSVRRLSDPTVGRKS